MTVSRRPPRAEGCSRITPCGPDRLARDPRPIAPGRQVGAPNRQQRTGLREHVRVWLFATLLPREHAGAPRALGLRARDALAGGRVAEAREADELAAAALDHQIAEGGLDGR